MAWPHPRVRKTLLVFARHFLFMKHTVFHDRLGTNTLMKAEHTEHLPYIRMRVRTRMYYSFHDAADDDDVTFEKRVDAVVREIGDRCQPMAAEGVPPVAIAAVLAVLAQLGIGFDCASKVYALNIISLELNQYNKSNSVTHAITTKTELLHNAFRFTRVRSNRF